MASTGLRPLDSGIHKTNEWLSQLALDLGVRDKLIALSALRAVLSTLREALPLDSSADLAAELPLMVRGIYFEDWVPSREPRSRTGLVARMNERLDPSLQARDSAIRAVFALLESRLSRSVVGTIRSDLDEETRALFPASPPDSESRVRAPDSRSRSSRPSSPRPR